MASFFIDEYHRHAKVKNLESRDLHLAGTAVTAVVAGRLVNLLSLKFFYVVYSIRASIIAMHPCHPRYLDHRPFSRVPIST